MVESFKEYRLRKHFPDTEEFKTLVQEATQFLDESFDKPFEKTENHISDEEREDIKHRTGVEDYREYHLHDGLGDKDNKTMMTVYKRGHAYEIHHTHPSGESGKMISTGKSNPRFVATMFHHAKGLIDQGHSVRIVGNKTNDMFDHYHRIAKALARKHDYVISRPHSHDQTSDSPDAHKYSEFLVSKNIHESTGDVYSCFIHNGAGRGPTRDMARITTFYGKL